MKPLNDEPPNLAPVTPSAPYAGTDKPVTVTAAKEAKPKGKKKVLTKSKAAQLKETLEKRQLGDTTPVDDKLTPKEHSRATKKAVLKILEPKSKQMDMVDDKKLKVKLDKIGKAASRFKNAVEQVDLAADEKGAASEALIKAMQQAKRYRYTVSGFAFELCHVGPKDTIKVVKPK